MAGKNATDENIANIRETWGFDEPFYTQYAMMMKKVFTADLISYTTQQDVIAEIKRGLPATISLAVGAAIIWLFFGVLVGVISAVTAGKLSDRAITILALIGISMPVFWLGILARYYLGPENLGLFPDGGYVPLTENPVQWFYHLILPWFVLAVLFIGFYGRVLRSNILDSINEDYVRTARAKGLEPASRDAQARPAELDDPDRHALRARLRRRDRRRRDPDRDRLRPSGRRAVRRAFGATRSTCRRSWR